MVNHQLNQYVQVIALIVYDKVLKRIVINKNKNKNEGKLSKM